MSADTELRNAVAERDGWSCRFCRCRLVPPPAGRNHTAAEATTIATLDHWVPRCRGGGDDLANLVIACRTCNEEKGALTGPEYLVVRAFRRLSDPRNRTSPAALDERLVAAVAGRTAHALLGKSAATVAPGDERANPSAHRCGADGTRPSPLPATWSEQRECRHARHQDRPGPGGMPGTSGPDGPANRATDRAAVPDHPAHNGSTGRTVPATGRGPGVAPPRPPSDQNPTAQKGSQSVTTVPLTPEQRSLRARIASHASWAKTEDPKARTAPARSAFFDRFEREVDPDGVLDPADRRRRAEHARKAHMQRLALKSARARRSRSQARKAGRTDGR